MENCNKNVPQNCQIPDNYDKNYMFTRLLIIVGAALLMNMFVDFYFSL